MLLFSAVTQSDCSVAHCRVMRDWGEMSALIVEQPPHICPAAAALWGLPASWGPPVALAGGVGVRCASCHPLPLCVCLSALGVEGWQLCATEVIKPLLSSSCFHLSDRITLQLHSI